MVSDHFPNLYDLHLKEVVYPEEHSESSEEGQIDGEIDSEVVDEDSTN